MKLYKHIENLLLNNSKVRNSDKYLIWCVFFALGFVHGEGENSSITFQEFKRAISPETIRRTRQKIVADYREKNMENLVSPDKKVRNLRQEIESKKGNFVYQQSL